MIEAGLVGTKWGGGYKKIKTPLKNYLDRKAKTWMVASLSRVNLILFKSWPQGEGLAKMVVYIGINRKEFKNLTSLSNPFEPETF